MVVVVVVVVVEAGDGGDSEDDGVNDEVKIGRPKPRAKCGEERREVRGGAGGGVKEVWNRHRDENGNGDYAG